MRIVMPVLLLVLAGCEDKGPPAPTTEESARLDEADAMLNEAGNEQRR